jgi:ATP-dependent Clp protease ATP-binding subunit ClpA
MSEISRVALFGKLNSLGYKAIEGATVFCKLRGNPYVELVHWIQQILQAQDSDLQRIVRYFELDVGKLAGDITAALDRLPRGATSISDLSEAVENAVERGWVYGSLMYRESHVRTGHLIVGALKTPSLRNALMAISRQFERIRGDTLTEDFEKIVAGSPEEALAANDGSGAAANLLKPVLARGTLRTIGATTFAEYKRYIEKDPAPTRRFQSIQVDEPSEAKALLIVSTLKGAPPGYVGDGEGGGRMIDAILTNTMLPRISEEFLRRMLEGKPVERVHVGVEGNDFQYGFD